MPRTMPKAGYYELSTTKYPFMREIVYTTGVRGGGGHCSCRLIDYNSFQNKNNPNIPKQTSKQHHKKFKNEWVCLQWNCVPPQAELNAEYTYSATCPSGWLDWK